MIAHLADGLEVAEEEAVAQAEGRAGLEGREDLLVQLRLFQSSQRKGTGSAFTTRGGGREHGEVRTLTRKR